ncbi:MAG: hypothetical protein IK065_00005, partial [Neisseriaceae bacterium]|nr:hypothetical protein [Neisseriaceae bacterium]
MALILNTVSKDASSSNLGVRRGANFKIKAQAGDKYHLIDDATGKNPTDLMVQRDGNNLILNSKFHDVKIVIEDFWAECSAGNQCFAIFDTPMEAG